MTRFARLSINYSRYVDYVYYFNPFNPECIIVIFIHYKPRIAVAILDL